MKSNNFEPLTKREEWFGEMKLTEKRLGYLINFNVAVIKDGIKRMIL